MVPPPDLQHADQEPQLLSRHLQLPLLHEVDVVPKDRERKSVL